MSDRQKDMVLTFHKVVEYVEEFVCVEEEFEFKTTFLMILLGDFLCPTTCRWLESKLLVAARLRWM